MVKTKVVPGNPFGVRVSTKVTLRPEMIDMTVGMIRLQTAATIRTKKVLLHQEGVPDIVSFRLLQIAKCWP